LTQPFLKHIKRHYPSLVRAETHIKAVIELLLQRLIRDPKRLEATLALRDYFSLADPLYLQNSDHHSALEVEDKTAERPRAFDHIGVELDVQDKLLAVLGCFDVLGGNNGRPVSLNIFDVLAAAE
jgi:hypothetical protein